MNVSFQGIDELVVTFQTSGQINQGDFVTLSGNGTVGPCEFGDAPVGRALNVRDGIAAVQLRGAMEAEYTGTLGLGFRKITAQGGQIKTAGSTDAFRNAIVLSTDATAKTACLLLW